MYCAAHMEIDRGQRLDVAKEATLGFVVLTMLVVSRDRHPAPYAPLTLPSPRARTDWVVSLTAAQRVTTRHLNKSEQLSFRNFG